MQTCKDKKIIAYLWILVRELKYTEHSCSVHGCRNQLAERRMKMNHDGGSKRASCWRNLGLSCVSSWLCARRHGIPSISEPDCRTEALCAAAALSAGISARSSQAVHALRVRQAQSRWFMHTTRICLSVPTWRKPWKARSSFKILWIDQASHAGRGQTHRWRSIHTTRVCPGLFSSRHLGPTSTFEPSLMWRNSRTFCCRSQAGSCRKHLLAANLCACSACRTFALRCGLTPRIRRQLLREIGICQLSRRS